jgi:hypothetical protein
VLGMTVMSLHEVSYHNFFHDHQKSRKTKYVSDLRCSRSRCEDVQKAAMLSCFCILVETNLL